MTLAEQLPLEGWNGRSLANIQATIGLEVRRLLGQAWEDVNSGPVPVTVEYGGIVRLPVFYTQLAGVTNAAGRSLSYEVAASCDGVPGFETSPRILSVMGASAGEQLTLTGTHGMSTVPAAVAEYAQAYGSILAQRMDRMGVKSKSMGNVNVTYSDGTGLSPRKEALQVTGAAVLAYRLEPLTPSLSLSKAGWVGV